MESETYKIFTEYHDFLKSEDDLREEIKAVVQQLEKTSRDILTILQRIHRTDGHSQIPQLCEQAEGHFIIVRQHYDTLSKLIPKDQYYRFNDHWRFANQRLCFLAALLVYLQKEELITKEITAKILGVADKREDGFHIDLESFLSGLLFLANELARFAVNSVTAGDYARPLKISKFVGDLNAGFRQLNLKNDALRKRYDALKYDMKKIEEVVYDLSIRGLKPIGDDRGESSLMAKTVDESTCD